MLTTIRRVLSLLLILAGCGMLLWAWLPNPRQALSQYIEPPAMQAPAAGFAQILASLEVRQVRMEWPTSLRIGEPGAITLSFDPVRSEIIVPKPEAQFSDVYNSYNLMAEGRFEVAGRRVDPANPIRESMPSGQTVKFTWQLSPQEIGTYECNVWLLLRFLPLDGSPASEVPVFVHQVDIQATSLFGLGGPQARLLGGVGIIASVILSLDLLFCRVIKRAERSVNRR